MPRTQSEIRKALQPAHLQAIGLVAAEWSRLELQVLSTIADVSGVSLQNVIILAAPAGLPDWMFTLKKLTKEARHDSKYEELEKLADRIDKLRSKRNRIVHGAWFSQSPNELQAALRTIKPSRVAKGYGIPKRGLQPVMPLAMTAKEMRDVAASIDAVI